MDCYVVNKLKNADIEVTVPGSKSITNRALLMAALNDGKCTINGALFSDDSRYFLKALIDLGYRVDIDEKEKKVDVYGQLLEIPDKSGEIYVGSAGTAARFLTAMVGMSDGIYTINASQQMKKRPMEPLFKVLESLGSSIEYLEKPYSLPVRIKGCYYKENMDTSDSTDNDREDSFHEPKDIYLDISKSTQFLSAILMAGVMYKGGLKIHITSEKKQGSYIDITRKMIKEFGGFADFDGETYYTGCNPYKIREYNVEPDVSAACYFYGMAAITGKKAVVHGVHSDSTQGDIRFLNVLKDMGCLVKDTKEGIAVTGPSKLKGVDIDMNNFSDQALTLANVAIFADSPTTIRNIGHIRGQECDRIKAICTNLKAMGIRCEEWEDGVKIYPSEPKAADIETFDDHRVAMAFTLAGLKAEGTRILNPMCCKKTFEEYFTIIDKLTEK